MTIDTKRLRELAEKATPGPWRSNPRTAKVYYLASGGDSADLSYILSENEASDAEFIAATDPQTVLALLDEIDRLRTGRDLSIERTRNSFTGECFERWVTPWEPLPEEDDAL